MRVVLDTNVFIDAFFNENEDCSLILKEEHRGEFTLVMSNDMNEELMRILNKSVKEWELTGTETVAVMKLVCRALLRADKIEPKKKFTKCEDKDDNMFFECAIEGNANYIISRDVHIHNVKNKQKLLNSKNEEINVLYPDEFIMEMKKIKLVANFNNR